MSTVPISISTDGLVIFKQTESGYTFNVRFPSSQFTEWNYNLPDPVFFGLGAVNSQDFKEFSSKSVVEMTINQRQSPLECIVLKIMVTNNSRNLVKKFNLYSEEIPFFPQTVLPKIGPCVALKTQDFTSLCKGFKTGLIRMRWTADGFSITSKLDGVREKCFLFPDHKDDVSIDAVLSADKLLSVIKLAMCVNKTIALWISEDRLVLSGESHLGTIEIMIMY